MVILDEATASVDRPTERILQEVIADFFKHSTVLIIAHRLETVINCNRWPNSIGEVTKPSV